MRFYLAFASIFLQYLCNRWEKFCSRSLEEIKVKNGCEKNACNTANNRLKDLHANAIAFL
jgi:hypothetical protein